MGTNHIEQRESEWLQAFNSGDASGVAQLYTTDGRILPPNSPIIEGRSAAEGFVKEFVATQAQLTFNLLTVHESADMCAAVGTYEMAIPGAPDDRGKFIEVWQRQPDGSWLIADDIFNSDLAPPAA